MNFKEKLTDKPIVIVSIIGCFLFFLLFYVDVYRISSGSMEDTLLNGDFVLVKRLHFKERKIKNRIPKRNRINRGDIVVLKNLGDTSRKYFIKRCIAEPGDTILNSSNNVHVNNKVQPFPKDSKFYYNFKSNDEHQLYSFTDSCKLPISKFRTNDFNICSSKLVINSLESKGIIFNVIKIQRVNRFGRKNLCNYPTTIIPKYGDILLSLQFGNNDFGYLFSKYEDNSNEIKNDYYFMMGDNRHNSLDSRSWGMIPETHIVGKVILVLFSIDDNARKSSRVRFNRTFMKVY